MNPVQSDLCILKSTITVGLQQPIRLLQITDTHITRDDPGLNRKAAFDVNYDGCAEAYFFQALDYAKKQGLTILHTGDLIDFFSPGNFAFIDSYFSDVNYIYAAGNHDFCHFLGRAKEDYAYKWEKINEIAPHIKNNLYFYSRVIGGVNVVTLDNSYYLITQGQIELLKAEVAKGLPILLAMHVPIYTEELHRCSPAGEPDYCMAAPQAILDGYTEDRRLQQTPDDATLTAVEYIKNEPLIKAVIAGHRHCNCDSELRAGLPQLVTHGSFAGYAREITVC